MRENSGGAHADSSPHIRVLNAGEKVPSPRRIAETPIGGMSRETETGMVGLLAASATSFLTAEGAGRNAGGFRPLLSGSGSDTRQPRLDNSVFLENRPPVDSSWTDVVNSIPPRNAETVLNVLTPNTTSRPSPSQSRDNPSTGNNHFNRWGLPPSHPGVTRRGVQGPSTPVHSGMIYPGNIPHDFKTTRSTYSPLSMGDATDQTSPMSSPSLSPHVSPSMRGRYAGEGLPSWHLSDGHPPQGSLSEHNPYLHHVNSPRSGPTSPPRHVQHRGTGTRPSQKSHSIQLATSHHRSSIEVLKTLLRKKACLYEPETSNAIALVTWLVGHKLALSQGFFSRQQLQAGVHASVASKIEAGHVTRTKVNRCMQVILNSCFHYIIPRPDGIEDGQAFRLTFEEEAVSQDHLLGGLAPPWNNLRIDTDAHREGVYQIDYNEKESSTSSQCDESADSSNKRSVLLCFNENVRCAADVFRCHNEFIRDVAVGKLCLSNEEWRHFFMGKNCRRNKPQSFEDLKLWDFHERVDLSKFRTTQCAKRYDHNHLVCAFAHIDVNSGWLRRDPSLFDYEPIMCKHVKPLRGSDCHFVNSCPLGKMCKHAHSREELMYHPQSYKLKPCTSGAQCRLSDVCPDIHSDTPTARGKRHSGSKMMRNNCISNSNSGFEKDPGDMPRTLYVDPAPLSFYEETLQLPGLQALFRDRSASIVYKEDPSYEYGVFGWKKV